MQRYAQLRNQACNGWTSGRNIIYTCRSYVSGMLNGTYLLEPMPLENNTRGSQSCLSLAWPAPFSCSLHFRLRECREQEEGAGHARLIAPDDVSLRKWPSQSQAELRARLDWIRSTTSCTVMAQRQMVYNTGPYLLRDFESA